MAEESAEILLDVLQVPVHGVVPDSVCSGCEQIARESLEPILEVAQERHLVMQFPARIEVHHFFDVTEEGFGRHLCDDVITDTGLYSCEVLPLSRVMLSVWRQYDRPLSDAGRLRRAA